MNFFRQPNDYTCGSACLKMLADHFGSNYKGNDYSINRIIRLCKNDENGTTIKNMYRALRELGLEKSKTSTGTLSGWNLALISDPEPYTDHFILVQKGVFGGEVRVLDPYEGFYTIPKHVLDCLIRRYGKNPWIWEIKKRG